jgi:hypothetical protein
MSVQVLTSVPITYEGANGPTHAPLVTGRLGSVARLFVLDTGSDVHLLTKELVDELGLAVEPGEEGTDHSGATVPSWSVEDSDLELGGLGLRLRGTFAVPAPRPFPAQGIGGILSPQHLHRTALAMIDMIENELLLVEASDEAAAAWLAERHPSLQTLVLERDHEFTGVVVRGAILPHAEIPTMLNTGGNGTEFSAAAVPGMTPGPAERIGGGVGDSDVMGAHTGAATLVVAGRELPVESLAVRETMHDPQGLVGMDVLRGTVLAVAAELSRPVFWQLAK